MYNQRKEQNTKEYEMDTWRREQHNGANDLDTQLVVWGKMFKYTEKPLFNESDKKPEVLDR